MSDTEQQTKLTSGAIAEALRELAHDLADFSALKGVLFRYLSEKGMFLWDFPYGWVVQNTGGEVIYKGTGYADCVRWALEQSGQ